MTSTAGKPNWIYRTTPKHLFPLHDLQGIFIHPHNSTLNFFSYPSPDPAQSSKSRYVYDPTHTPETIPLPPSPPPPAPPHPLGHLVSYVVLFGNAHPAWNDQHELWTHTNGEKLIKDYEEDKKNFNRPIPVFKSFRGHDRRAEFEFIGWWEMLSLEIAESQSEELKRMMQVKEQSRGYGRNGRTASAWAESLSARWIKLKFARDTEDLKEPLQLTEKRGEKYLLEIGKLDEELEILEGLASNIQLNCSVFIKSNTKDKVLLTNTKGYQPAYSTSDPWTGPRMGYFDGERQMVYVACDFYNLFLTPQLSTTTFFAFKDSNPYALPEERWHKDHPPPPSAMFNEKPHPLGNLISFVVIFHNAHPAWEDDNEIWVHSKVNLLLGGYNGEKKNFGRPIPVFKGGRSKFGKFVFEDWMTMDISAIVQPNSGELRRMLQAKEENKSRTTEAWKESLSFKWLKLKFTPITDKFYRTPAKMKRGEAARYALKIGGLEKELEIFNKLEIDGNDEED